MLKKMAIVLLTIIVKKVTNCHNFFMHECTEGRGAAEGTKDEERRIFVGRTHEESVSWPRSKRADALILPFIPSISRRDRAVLST